jgi:membrane-bound serine protease (ClpP class)
MRRIPLVAAIVCACALAGGADADVATSAPHVVVLRLDGSIQPASLRYLRRGLAQAARERAPLIVLELDTPGGLLVSLREMTAAITAAGPPVVTYVTPAGARAASAGFFVLLAGDVAAMAPGTNTGAAHPVTIGAKGLGMSKELEKATNDTAALARSLARQRARPVSLAEKAVRESRSYTEREAQASGLIDVVARDRGALLRALDGRAVRRFDGRQQALALRGVVVAVVSPNVAERLLMLVADPQVAYLLLILGALGVFLELTHPGLVAPGVLGAVSVMLALYGFSVLPVNVVGVLLLLAAVGFFVAEAMVTSHGLLAVMGVVCFVLGSVMLVDVPVGTRGISLWLVLPMAALMGAVTVLLVTRVARARRAPALAGVEALVGEEGEVVVPLAPEGKVFVHGEYWDARGAREAPRGTRVRVTGVRGAKLLVAESAPAR